MTQNQTERKEAEFCLTIIRLKNNKPSAPLRAVIRPDQTRENPPCST